MANHGTTPGYYIEFQTAVLRALPRDIEKDVALGWTQNGESLARILRRALVPNNEAYELLVDYDLNIEKAVELGRYDVVDYRVFNSLNFKTLQKGKKRVIVDLVRFDECFSTDEVLRELNTMGYRPAELHELLALGESEPHVQCKGDMITALGSVWKSRAGKLYVPFLDGVAHERMLFLAHIMGDKDDLENPRDNWGTSVRFAAVKKNGT
ncbi:MAG: hypothetical protein AAB727_03720 [Patescibacteria group bacterium]